MMTEKDAQAIGKALGRRLEPILQRLVEVEARLSMLEARPSARYAGVWTSDEGYREGDLATDKGSLWACTKATRSRPGSDATWKLMAKSGHSRSNGKAHP